MRILGTNDVSIYKHCSGIDMSVTVPMKLCNAGQENVHNIVIGEQEGQVTYQTIHGSRVYARRYCRMIPMGRCVQDQSATDMAYARKH